jgi:DNA-binding transcriptional ArsR family regulator
MPSRVVFDPLLSEFSRLLYAALLCYERWHQTPTEAEIAADFRVSERTVRRGMAELVGAGLVTRKRKGHGERRGGDASTFEVPDIHRPPPSCHSRIHRTPVASPKDRPPVAGPKAVQPKKSETAEERPARLPADAGGDDDTRRTVLDYLQHHTGVYADRADAMVHRDAPAVLEQLQREGVVVLEEQAFGPYYRLTKEGEQC